MTSDLGNPVVTACCLDVLRVVAVPRALETEMEKLEEKVGGRAPWGKDGTVSVELTPSILLSHLFLYINKTVVLLKG